MILRVVDSTADTIGELAAALVAALEESIAGLIGDYRELGVAVVAHRPDASIQRHTLSASEFQTRVVAGSPPNRWASHTGMIATSVNAAATTLMTGA